MTENWDQFRRAALVLVGPGPVKQRLCDAYLKHLRAVDVDELPAGLQTDYATLEQALTTAQATGGLGAVEVTVRKMSEQDAGRHAGCVLDMFIALSRIDDRERTAPPHRPMRLIVEDDEIPAFLNRA
jgi:hypothetical protein